VNRRDSRRAAVFKISPVMPICAISRATIPDYMAQFASSPEAAIQLIAPGTLQVVV
jgi:hypothetical protein